MTGVDVLAVLSHHEAALRAKCGTPLNELAEARGAVAELIEAADEAYGEMLADSTRDGPRCLLLTRLEAALARCRPSEIPTELNTDTPAPRAPGACA